MKKLLNTLYVTRQGVYLSKDLECVLVQEKKETLLRVPIHTLESIVCFGRVSASPPLMGFCGDRKVLLSFFTEQGEFLARAQGPVSGNVLLRREQYRIADEARRSAHIVRSIVAAKVANCRIVLLRAQREQGTGECDLSDAVAVLGRILEGITRRDLTVEELRGCEGEAAKTYFGVFDHLIVAQKEDFRFQGRNRRPPLDRVNALLSFLYTLLVHDCMAALEGIGLDPYVGMLHADRPGRPGLALDLMEEMRPPLADRLALSLINRRQVDAGGFEIRDNGAVVMTPGCRKEVLTAWQKRKQEEVMHAIVGERAPLGLFPHLQAMLLARHVRGDLEGYPALLWK